MERFARLNCTRPPHQLLRRPADYRLQDDFLINGIAGRTTELIVGLSMYSTCLYCHSNLGANESIEVFQVGKRLAYDERNGRLWVVCGSCGRWNLTPLDERHEAIETCEKLFRASPLRVTTDEIGLARLRDGTELVRIGEPLRPEFAAWRYGQRFVQRRMRSQLAAGSTAIVAGVGALAVGAGAIAFAPLLAPAVTLFGQFSIVVVPAMTAAAGTVPVVGALAAKEYAQRGRIVGRFNRHGRVVTVRAKHAEAAELRVTGVDSPAVTLDVPHDEGWAHFDGIEAMHAASTVLAGANRFGASASQVQDAVDEVEAFGDATRYLIAASDLGGSRGGRITSVLRAWRQLGTMRLSRTECLALEMSLHEESERRAFEGELAILEAAWREAEELAQVADGL